MLGRAAWCACAFSALAAAAPALAGEPPSAEQVAKAEAAFDDGAIAFRAGNFELAASRFEAAYAAHPSAVALRNAMLSRAEVEQPARAATLAALALSRHADDGELAKAAQAILSEREASLHRLEVRCKPACRLAIDARAVPGGAQGRAVVYLDPGEVTLSASFAGVDQAEQQLIDARPGGRNELVLEPHGAPPPPPSKPAPPIEPDRPRPGSSLPAEPPPQGADGGPSWIESPLVFLAGATATAALGGVTIWSGIDTINDPGVDYVREVCAGKGPDCPEYQTGRDKQLRTNVLIGATAGVGALTAALGLFVTEWSSDSESAAVSIVLGCPDAEGGVAASGRF